jgi:hypothetical protein
MFHDHIAVVRLQNRDIQIRQNGETGAVTVFKTQGSRCDWQMFDRTDRESIIEYIIEPFALSGWGLVMDPDQ